MKKVRSGIFLTGRVLVGLFYLFTGANHFLDLRAMSGYADSMGVPIPSVSVMVSGLLLLAAGITFLLGFKPEIGIAALLLFYLPVSFMMHPFWTMTDTAAQTEMIDFIKNMALLGSALSFAALPKPWPLSVDMKLARASSRLKQEETTAGGV